MTSLVKATDRAIAAENKRWTDDPEASEREARRYADQALFGLFLRAVLPVQMAELTARKCAELRAETEALR